MRIRNQAIRFVLLVIFVLTSIILFGRRACFWARYGSGPYSSNVSITDIDQNFTFPKNFPSDPGKEGKKTLQGIDADQDGVRDDLQRWIYAMHSREPEKQNALRQWARYYQHSLQREFGLEVRKDNRKMLDRAIDCAFLTFGDIYQADYEIRHLEAKALNTYERTARYLDNDRKTTAEEMASERYKDDHPCDNQ